MSVSVNPPMTPVTAGSNGIAAATTPNVCKMPGPPAPFVPTPLPNIGKSAQSPKNYSKSVVIQRKKVAIKGATFKSIGDAASKGTGGGVVSAATHGVTKFVGPGSMNVKIEGKNVQLLSDPMLNNCGSIGAPANAATMTGVLQPSGLVTAVESQQCALCGEEHGPLEESLATKTDLGVLRFQFSARIRAINVRRASENAELTAEWLVKSNSRPPERLIKNNVPVRTMLGVAECKCKKQYADQSGLTTIELCDAADDASMRHANGITASYDQSNKVKKRARVAQINATRDALQRHTGNSALVLQQWERAAEIAAASGERRNEPPAYPPGACAAPRALLLLIEDNALPAAMTEEWYHSEGEATDAPIEYIDARQGGRELRVDHFQDRETVPPCRTCVLVVPMLICTRGAATCNHRT